MRAIAFGTVAGPALPGALLRVSAIRGPSTIAALFVETNGCYFGLEGVEPWDKRRDARLYAGPHPVVAHPPCQRWGAMAFVNYARWGGEHNRPGNDGGCFGVALDAVNRFGGVLEHPANSRAWGLHGLLKPLGGGWSRSGEGWACEVWQSAYGHRANKATWLYYRGSALPPSLRWERPIGSHQIGFHDQRGKERNKPTLGKREASATPIAFRDLLLSLARAASGMEARRAAAENTDAVHDSPTGEAGDAQTSVHPPSRPTQ